ncbi:ATP-binding cassette domain-containing protein [Balneolaceae bacterium ANBcel3]|nr:ATP-binding cassette domain-containing protein [Balneolaceae bacterium ANBcel3]
MNNSVVSFENVSKRFGKQYAVDGVSFEVQEGRIFGLLGPNGAGKTTSIRMLTNILVPDEGVVRLGGEVVSPETQRHIGYLPEERGLYKKMKVKEQLIYFSRLKGLSRSDSAKSISYWLDRFGAKEWAEKEVSELSKGMQQKIQFIATIAHDPMCLIFDEPFSGLDPINSELLKDIILELRSTGKTIFFATHRMEQVEQLCDDIALFNHGKLVLSGEVSKVKAAFGKNTLKIRFKGSPDFLNQLEHVRIASKSQHSAEIVLKDGADDQKILRHALDSVHVHSFELIEPSVQEIFIDTISKS